MERYQGVAQLCQQYLNPTRFQIHEPDESLCDFETLSLVHSTEYIHKCFNLNMSPKEIRTIGFPWNQEFLLRTKKIVAGSIEALTFALENGVACNLAGGFHHAFRDRGEGFCVFNDIVLIGALALTSHPQRIKKVLVVDLDVHQGNGTASILKDQKTPEFVRKGMFSYSIHAKDNYPFEKEQSDYDIELEDGTQDEEFLQVLGSTLLPVFHFVDPDLLIFQSGVDGLASDRWGRLKLSRQGLRKRNQFVFDLCKQHKTPVISLMGGGYSNPISESIQCHADVVTDSLICLNESKVMLKTA